MKQMKVLLGLSLAAAVIALPARADSTASLNSSTSSTSSGLMENILKKTRANYTFEVNGANVAALSGNVAGGGTNLTLVHYPSVGYRVGGKWNIMVTQPFAQNIDETPQGQPGASRSFDALDPYISINNSRILGSNHLSFNLSGQFRYYVPVSRGTVNNANDVKATESGNGLTRTLLNPSFALMDGALEINTPVYFYYQFARRSDAERLAKNGTASRRDYRIYPAVIAGYQTWKNVQTYLETGVLFDHFSHKTTGSFSKFDDKSDGWYLSPGLNINVGKKLSINTAAYLGPFAFNVKKASLYMAATYVFL